MDEEKDVKEEATGELESWRVREIEPKIKSSNDVIQNIT